MPSDPSDGAIPFALRVRSHLPSTPGLEPSQEERCRSQGRWEELIEILLMRLDTAGAAGEKARLFVEIGDVFRAGLGDGRQALDALLEAWQLDPTLETAILPLEELARDQGRWPEVFALTEKLVTGERDPARAMAMCDRMVWWLTLEVPTPELAAYYAERIRVVDSTHPAVHLHLATAFRAHGDLKRELEELDRAALSAKRPEDQAKLHVLMAARQTNPIEARKHLARALAEDARSIGALTGLATIFEKEGDLKALADVLEKHAEAARKDEDKVRVLRRLADLYERQFLQPAKAAEKLQVAFALDPNDAETLTALTRCYQAMRAWPELARALEVAALEGDEATQRAALQQLASVQEAHLNDAPASIRTYEQLLALDTGGQDPVLLEELARLTEKAGDWQAAARWKGELALQSPEPSVRGRMHAAAGQLLAAADRDPHAARAHFEQAVANDPSNEAAWSALLWDAREAKDYARVAAYLQARASKADAGRMRAELYVELAVLRETQQNDELGALVAYEAARAADPTNEKAARALLELYVGTGRWEDADPVCERVVIAAERDRDLDTLCWALRLGRKIALGRGEAGRALSIAVSCFEVRPGLEEVRADLVESAFGLSAAELGPARDALATLADRGEELEPKMRAELGDVMAACGDTARAGKLYESALEASKTNARALAGLALLSRTKGDFAAAGDLQSRHAQTMAADDERYARLVEAGDTFANKANDAARAVIAYEEARALRPTDHQLLHALLGQYQALENWQKIGEVLRVLADGDTDRLRKSKMVFTMAQIARDKMNDTPSAIVLFEESLDLDPSRLEAFERIVRMHTESHDWPALADSYRRMLMRILGQGDTKLQHALYHQLGLVYRDRLKDLGHAVEAFRAAAELRPEATEDQTILRELLALGGRVEDAVLVALAQVRRDPLSPSAYPELFDWLLDATVLDRAWCVASVMNHLGVAHPPAAAFLRAHPPRLEPTSGSLDGSNELLVHSDLDPALTAVFAAAVPAVIELKLAQVSWRERISHPGPPLPANAAWVVAGIEYASHALGLLPPRLFLRQTAGPALTVAATRPASLLVAPDGLAAVPDPLRPFVYGKRTFELAPPLLARAVCPSVSELATLLGVAARAVAPRDQPRTPPDEAFRSKLRKPELDALADAVAAATTRGVTVDHVQRWSELADLSTSRAGLLLVADVDLARGALSREPLSPGDLPLREQMKELVLFALSDTFVEMRKKLGIAL